MATKPITWPEYGEAWLVHGMRVIYAGANPATVLHFTIEPGATMQVTVSVWRKWRKERIVNRSRV
jgi:hypothetical protein